MAMSPLHGRQATAGGTRGIVHFFRVSLSLSLPCSFRRSSCQCRVSALAAQAISLSAGEVRRCRGRRERPRLSRGVSGEGYQALRTPKPLAAARAGPPVLVWSGCPGPGGTFNLNGVLPQAAENPSWSQALRRALAANERKNLFFFVRQYRCKGGIVRSKLRHGPPGPVLQST